MGATLGTWLLTWLRGARDGTDEYCNRYFRLKNSGPHPLGGEGEPEGSKVPPEWHAWLHHMYDEAPRPRWRYRWEKPHPTGIPLSYHPRGSVLRGSGLESQ